MKTETDTGATNPERINERSKAFGACGRILRKIPLPSDRMRVIAALQIIFEEGPERPAPVEQ